MGPAAAALISLHRGRPQAELAIDGAVEARPEVRNAQIGQLTRQAEVAGGPVEGLNTVDSVHVMGLDGTQAANLHRREPVTTAAARLADPHGHRAIRRRLMEPADRDDVAEALHSPRHDVNTARKITRPAGMSVTTTDTAVPSVNAIGPNTGVLTRQSRATSSSRIQPHV